MELIEQLKERFNFTDEQIKESGISLVKTGFDVLPLDEAIDVIAAQIYLRSKDNNTDVDELIDRIKSVINEIEILMKKIGE